MDPKDEKRIADLEQENRDLKEENKRLKQEARFGEALSEGLEELVREKMAAGLDRSTAIEAAKNQLKHDAAEKAAAKTAKK